jgi:Glyoxalase-like domain
MGALNLRPYVCKTRNNFLQSTIYNLPMSLYLDHVLIAAPDVDAAVEQLGRALGLVFAPPSYHSGSATYNRMARFANGASLELLGITSHDQPATVGGATHDFSYFDNGPSQFGLALRSDDLPALLAQSRERGGSLSEPEYGGARLPDGMVRSWMSSHPTELVGEQFLVVPFVIQYTEGWGPALWRIQGLLEHELDYFGIAGISVTTTLSELDYPYWLNFGLMNLQVGLEGTPFYPLDEGFIETMVVKDTENGHHQPEYPPQVDTIFLAVSDIREAAAKLRAWKVEFVEQRRWDERVTLRIDPQATIGLHFALISEE